MEKLFIACYCVSVVLMGYIVLKPLIRLHLSAFRKANKDMVKSGKYEVLKSNI